MSKEIYTTRRKNILIRFCKAIQGLFSDFIVVSNKNKSNFEDNTIRGKLVNLTSCSANLFPAQ
ncbi:MAG: hypothetical protein HeimC3_53440 [Candidatus Heimdallarchaeota archaeon LC_3]|nr:MAG: hypothetical protein HeimC3_53440 [Candidatus Heimdallarchaeota archaeon LC_3]